MNSHKSNRSVIPFERCVSEFHCIFPPEAGTDKIDGQRGFYVGINLEQKFIPVGVDVSLEYKWWSLLRDISFRWLPDFNNYDPLKDAI